MSQTPEEIANRIMTKFSMKYLNHAPLELEIEAAIQQERVRLEASERALAEAQKDTRRLNQLIEQTEFIGFSSGDREPDTWIPSKKLREIIDSWEKDCSK